MRPILLAAFGAVAGAVSGTIAGLGLGGISNDDVVFGITGLFAGAIIGAVVAIRLSRPDRPDPDGRAG